MSITANELEAIVEKMLVEGVPPGVVARVFDLDPDLVKDAQRSVRVATYGTDDLNDYLEQMNWDAIEAARTALATGSMADKQKVMASVLGKQMTAAAKRAPEGQRNQRQAIEKMFAHMRGDDAQP